MSTWQVPDNCWHGDIGFPSRDVYNEYSHVPEADKQAWRDKPENAGRWRLKRAEPVSKDEGRGAPRVNGVSIPGISSDMLAFLEFRYGNGRAAFVCSTADGIKQTKWAGYSVPPLKPGQTNAERYSKIWEQRNEAGRNCYVPVGELSDEWHADKIRTTPEHNERIKNGQPSHVVEHHCLGVDTDAEKYGGNDPQQAAQWYLDEGIRVEQRVREGCAKLGIRIAALLKSSTGGRQAWIKTDRPMTPDEYEDLCGRLHRALGFDPVVRNPNRILRLADTVNGKSGKHGRVPSPCTLVFIDKDAVASVDHLYKVLAPFGEQPKSDDVAATKAGGTATKAEKPKLEIDGAKVKEHEGWLKSVADLPTDFPPKGRIIVGHHGTLDDLNDKLKEAGLIEKPYRSRSDVTHALAAVFKADSRFSVEKIAAALMCKLPCNKHVLDNDDPVRAARRAIERSYEPPAKRIPGNWPDGVNDENGIPNPGMDNTLTGIDGLGLNLWRDEFRHKQFVRGNVIGEEFDGEIGDDFVTMMRLETKRKFGFYPSKDVAYDAVAVACHTHRRNPVIEYLDQLEWDGVERLDSALHTYLGAPSSPYVRAVSRKVFCAMVRRAKQPGCKFDYVLTLDGNQSIGKTMFCRDLAGKADLYTDSAIIAHSPKEAMETMGGKWVIEIGELAGFGTTAREKVKAFITRQDDRARMAYDRFAHDQPRACIFIATKNPGGFLDDPTGERRWWVVLVTKYDRDAFLRDRDQLFAEAVVREPNEKLWLDDPEIAKEHADLATISKAPNALVDTLENLRGEMFVTHEFVNGALREVREERVSNTAVRQHLGLTDADTVRMHALGRKLAEAMAHLGWAKTEVSIRCSHKHARTERGYRRRWTGGAEELDLGTPEARTEVPF